MHGKIWNENIWYLQDTQSTNGTARRQAITQTFTELLQTWTKDQVFRAGVNVLPIKRSATFLKTYLYQAP